MQPNAYVYAIAVDGVVRYIGKGTLQRAWSHSKYARSIIRRRDSGERVRTTMFYNRLAKAVRAGAQIDEVILVEGLSHKAAFAREKLEIAATAKGQLWNKLEGGDGLSSEEASALWENPRYRDRVTKKMRALWRDPVYQSMMKAAHAARVADPKKMALHIEVRNTPEWRDGASAQSKRNWADPAIRQKMQSGLKLASARESTKAKKTAAVTATWADPEVRAKRVKAMSIAAREKWAKLRAKVAA